MKFFILLLMLLSLDNAIGCGQCPNERAFDENGWVIHSGEHFHKILAEKLHEFIPELGKDLVLDDAESYLSDFSHDTYLILWVVILDRVSTPRDEMWGDVAFARTGPCTAEYIELRWYDPATKKKHIVCNPEYAFCLTTKVPLAYNTIF